MMAGDRWSEVLPHRQAGVLQNFGRGKAMNSWALLGSFWPFYGLLFLIGTENYIISPLIPSIALEGGYSVKALATMVTAYALPYALTAPIFGALSDRIGRTRLIIIGATFFMAGNWLVASAHSLHMLLLGRAVAGFGGAMAGPAIWAHMADSTPPDVRGRAMGLGMGAFAMGQVIGLPLGGVVAGILSWRGTFGVIGALMAPIIAGTCLVFYNRGNPPGRNDSRPSNPSIFSIWKSGKIRVAFLVNFLFHAGNLASYTYLGFLLVTYSGQSVGEISAIGIYVGGGTLMGALMGGRILDFWREKGGNSAHLLAGWAFLLGLAILVATSPFPFPIKMISLTCWFFSSGAFVTTQQTFLTISAPSMKATAISWNNSIMYAGAGIGVMVMGVGISNEIPVGVIGMGFGIAAAVCATILAKMEKPQIAEKLA